MGNWSTSFSGKIINNDRVTGGHLIVVKYDHKAF